MGKPDYPKSPRPEYLKNSIHDSGRRVLGIDCNFSKAAQLYPLKNEPIKPTLLKSGKKLFWLQKHLKPMAFTFGIMGLIFLLDSLVFSVFDHATVLVQRKEERSHLVSNGSEVPIQMYAGLSNLASRALQKKEFEQDSLSLREENYPRTTEWRPCMDINVHRNIGKAKKKTGYILVSANGGLNQQRVAVCNSVAVAFLLNATLVIPKFLFSNVWKDPSQFGDIYQEEYFINKLRDDVKIVKELPYHLRSLDFKALGSLITDADLPKEALPEDYNRIVLPPLLKNGVIHLLGYGNRLGFDPLPSQLQRLRCKCNFHALKFVPKIQNTAWLLIKRMKQHGSPKNKLEKELLGNFSANVSSKAKDDVRHISKYLALHLRFEIDMVAYSQCEFGGGEEERNELKDYRESHFPLLIDRLKNSNQFGDIYQEEYFINKLRDDVKIVKELPYHLRSLDFKALGSLITDADLPKEALPEDYNRIVLPPLLKNGVIHLLGYGNRLGFDPLPSQLQRLRCKCNFHALKFVPKIQNTAWLLIKRMKQHGSPKNKLEKELLGNFSANVSSKAKDDVRHISKYLALHLRFEIDMVAYSQCEFGGGEEERNELKDYRESHFPLLIDRLKNSKPVSGAELRMLGRCPLTPEEAALVFAGIGVKKKTLIYLAGSGIYGGHSRMHPLTSLYPNMITKEHLLTPIELEPFRKFSSQLAALDFIACAAADVFAMTDSGSQLSSLVTGFRAYYGDGNAPSLRPSKKRLAAILSENSTIEWGVFENRIRKMIQETQRVRARQYGKSIYRQPRCTECMCKY